MAAVSLKEEKKDEVKEKEAGSNKSNSKIKKCQEMHENSLLEN